MVRSARQLVSVCVVLTQHVKTMELDFNLIYEINLWKMDLLPQNALGP